MPGALRQEQDLGAPSAGAYVPCAAKGSRLDRGGVRSQLATLPAAADGTAQLALRLTLQLVSRRGSLMEERIKGFLTSI